MMLDRRQFLGAAAAGAALTIIGGGVGGNDALGAVAVARPRLLDALGADTVREIGHAYRAAVPDESTLEALEVALRSAHASSDCGGRKCRSLDSLRSLGMTDSLSSRAKSRDLHLHSSLGMTGEERARADFAAGRVVVVRGWILSVTEARECALFSLLG